MSAQTMVEGAGAATLGAAVDGMRAGPRVHRFALSGAMPLRVGMRFGQTLDFRDWVEIGRRVGLHANASLWWLGDWLIFGRENYRRSYKRGVLLTGLEYKTLRNYAVVARCFGVSRRRDTLSFQHHAEVCALPREEQDLWLDRAEAEGWTRNELRRRLRLERTGESSTTAVTVRLSTEPTRTARWERAAALSESELQQWIVNVLDEAANKLLSDA